MLNSNDMAKVISKLAADARKREMHDILSQMDVTARVNLVNGTRSLVEISHEIERQAHLVQPAAAASTTASMIG